MRKFVSSHFANNSDLICSSEIPALSASVTSNNLNSVTIFGIGVPVLFLMTNVTRSLSCVFGGYFVLVSPGVAVYWDPPVADFTDWVALVQADNANKNTSPSELPLLKPNNFGLFKNLPIGHPLFLSSPTPSDTNLGAK